jgi:hypothetical protein
MGWPLAGQLPVLLLLLLLAAAWAVVASWSVRLHDGCGGPSSSGGRHATMLHCCNETGY